MMKCRDSRVSAPFLRFIRDLTRNVIPATSRRGFIEQPLAVPSPADSAALLRPKNRTARKSGVSVVWSGVPRHPAFIRREEMIRLQRIQQGSGDSPTARGSVVRSRLILKIAVPVCLGMGLAWLAPSLRADDVAAG